MKARVLGSGVIFVDESPISLQTPGKGHCKKAYMWIYAGGGGGDPPYRFFEFRTSRSHAHVEQTLKDYQGVLHSDKYAAYEKLAKREEDPVVPVHGARPAQIRRGRRRRS